MLPKNYITAAAERFPQKTAVIFKDQAVTFGDLDALIDEMAAQFSTLGMQRGDCVVLGIPNSLLFEIVFFAVLRNDAVAFLVPVDSNPEEMRTIVSGVSVDFSIVPENTSLPALGELEHASGKLLAVGSKENKYSARLLHEQPGLFHADADSRAQQATDGYIARMVSSGSTGANKHVLRSGESINHMCSAIKQSYGIIDEDVLLDLAPPHHIIGSGLIMLAAYLCTTIVLEEKFVPTQILEDIQRYHVSMFMISPFIFDMLSQTAGVEQYDLSSLRLAISVGAPLTEDVYRRIHERCNIPLHELYGSTEATIVTFRLDTGNFEKGMVGIPTTETTVKIFDDQYNELPVGRVGTIAAASPMVVKSYFNGSIPTRQGFHNDFLCIGDQGFLDEHGRLHVVGRSNLVINVGGRKVDIGEVEHVLNTHPSVVESGVYGVTEGNTEMVAAAVARSNETVTAEELMRWCRTHLSAYKVPKRIVFVSALPRHQTGKIMRQKLPQLSE